MNKHIKNFGVLLGDHIDTYRAGAVKGALPFEERNPSGDWETYLPLEEKQYNDNGDSMSCVTFAEVSGIEVEEKRITGIEPNYSDRWTAKMSGTTREGNYLWKVADTIRKFGLVKEESYPKPEGKWTWDEYHKIIPEPLYSKLFNEGQEWLKRWDVKYEAIEFSKASLIKHLKMSPLSVVVPGHCVLNFLTTKDVISYFDTYEPHKKTVPNVIQAMKVVLYKKEQAVPDEDLLVDLKLGDTGRQVEKLLDALDSLGWKLEVKQTVFVYDLKVADLVMRFKLAGPLSYSYWARQWERFGPADWGYRGRRVDSGTREYINKLIK